jgi:WD40 repeat protein
MNPDPHNSPSTLFGTSQPLPPPPVPDHELLSRIGRGAYGEVWLARSATGAYRAVKIVHYAPVKIVHRRSFDHDRPFEREFEGILKFEPVSRTHDSQVDILHVGRGDDCFYYVMELADDQVTGGQINPEDYSPRTLKSDLLFYERLPFEECVRIGIALATALEHLHTNGLAHRDVKPSNIIFVNGVPRLADIGLVAGVDATRSYVGTEGFAAPEGPGTPQADLYSLGKVLYEISTGKDRQDFPDLPTRLRELPDREGLMEINAVIVRACRHDPKDRYSLASAMRIELELLQSGKSLARLHRAEKRLRFVQRAGAIVTALAVLIALGWLWQAKQTNVVRRLAQEKEHERNIAHENLYHADIRASYHDWESGQITGVLERLMRHIPQGTEPELRGWEWYYLLSLCHSDERTLRGHQGEVLSVSCDRKNRRFATGGTDHTVRIWDAETRNSTAELIGHTGPVKCVSWNPQGGQLASGGYDGKLIVWDVESRQKLLTLNGQEKIMSLAWSPDGKRIATGIDGNLLTGASAQLIIWNATSGHRMIVKQGLTYSLAWHPAGKILVSGGRSTGGIIQVWDGDQGQLVRTIKAHGHSVFSLAWDPAGQRLASGSHDQRVRIWDKETWEPVTTIDPAHKGQVRSLAWSEDGQKLVSGGNDGLVKIWDPKGGLQLNILRGHQGPVNGVAWEPTHDRILSSGTDTVKVWNPQTEQAVQALGAGSTFAWHPNGEQIAVGTGHGDTWDSSATNSTITILNVPNLQKLFTLQCISTSLPFSLAWSSDAQKLSVGFMSGDVEAWDVSSRKQLLSLPKAHGGLEVRSVAWSPNARFLATAGQDRAVRLWNMETRQNTFTFPGHSERISSAVWSPDGHRIASKDWMGTVLVWEVLTGEVKLKLNGPVGFNPGKQYDVTWNPRGDKLATGNCDGTVTIWDAETGRQINVLKGHTSVVRSVCWSPDGRRLFSGAEDRTLRIWDSRSGRELLVLPDKVQNHNPVVNWSPSGRMIAVSDSTLMIFDARMGYQLAPQLALQK